MFLRKTKKLLLTTKLMKFPKIDKSIFGLSSLGAVFASLCCLSPLLLVIFGLSSISFAASLSNTLYGDYKWAFRAFGFVLMGIFLFFYFRRKGICTLDEAKRNRTKIINTILIAIISFVLSYLIFLYVIVEYIGKLYGIW